MFADACTGEEGSASMELDGPGALGAQRKGSRSWGLLGGPGCGTHLWL